jgi:flagellar export protein FliJ
MKGKKRFLVEEKRLKVTHIERMIADFERMDVDLQNEITTEQKRVRIHDPTNFAYPLFAKATNQRSENLKRSIDELKSKLEDAKAALAAAVDELNKLEMLEERRRMPELTPTVSMSAPLSNGPAVSRGLGRRASKF